MIYELPEGDPVFTTFIIDMSPFVELYELTTP